MNIIKTKVCPDSEYPVYIVCEAIKSIYYDNKGKTVVTLEDEEIFRLDGNKANELVKLVLSLTGGKLATLE